MDLNELKNKKHLLLVMGDLVKIRVLLFDPVNIINEAERKELIENLKFLKGKVKSFFDRSKELLKIEEDIELIPSNNNTIENLAVGQALLSNLIIVTTKHLIYKKDIENYTNLELIEEFKVGYGLYFGSLEVS